MHSNEMILFGTTESHTVLFSDGQRIHREVVEPLRELQKKAATEGFELFVCSGFRSFDRQLEIWNKKVKVSQCPTDTETLHSILRWSALPGLSRHHWGTDFDVIDKSKLKPGTQVQLVPEEFQVGGPFCELHDWLDVHLTQFGFFRPYQTDKGGVSPERWHLSYAPLSQTYLEDLKLSKVEEFLKQTDLLLKEQILKELPTLFNRYTLNIDLP